MIGGGGLCGAALGRGGVDCKISVRGGGCTRMGCGMWGEEGGVGCLERYRCDIILYTDSSYYYYNMKRAPYLIILLHKSRSWLNVIF